MMNKIVSKKRYSSNQLFMHLGLVAVLAVLIGGVAVTTAYGQASTTTIRNTFTFSDGILNPCNGESVLFDGTINSVSHFTNTPNGGTIINFNLQSTGHGQGDLGNTYNINYNDHFKFISQPGAAHLESPVISIRVISQGSSAENFILETIFRVTFNANGEPTHVDVEAGPGECLGLPPPPPNECTDCFLGHDEGGTLLPTFVDSLKDFFDTEPIFHEFQVRSIAELCFAIDNTVLKPVTEQEIRTLFDDPLLSNSPKQIQQIIDCLIELGLITPTP
ncbi:MAG TPA: hypothetical protein VHJ38_14720 [Nitrososphaeraceae archaeon]|nr:hypothetical protein [Nitrososphaeraceae archaeon]